MTSQLHLCAGITYVVLVMHSSCVLHAEGFRCLPRDAEEAFAMTRILDAGANVSAERRNHLPSGFLAQAITSKVSVHTSFGRGRSGPCYSLFGCFESCGKKCKKNKKPYCVLERKVKPPVLDSIVPCQHLAGVEGIQSAQAASKWEFLWRRARAEAAKAKRQRSVDILHINSRGFRKKNYAHIHFCRLNKRGFQFRKELKSVCGKTNSWENFTLAKCKNVSASVQSRDKPVFSAVQKHFDTNLADVGISVWLDVCPGKSVVMGTMKCSVETLLCDRQFFKRKR